MALYDIVSKSKGFLYTTVDGSKATALERARDIGPDAKVEYVHDDSDEDGGEPPPRRSKKSNPMSSDALGALLLGGVTLAIGALLYFGKSR